MPDIITATLVLHAVMEGLGAALFLSGNQGLVLKGQSRMDKRTKSLCLGLGGACDIDEHDTTVVGVCACAMPWQHRSTCVCVRCRGIRDASMLCSGHALSSWCVAI